MKTTGLIGKGSGKLGSTVFVQSGGEQIVREYNPNVTNPQTVNQVNQRTKFKLMTQLAAAMASVLVYPKKGLKSARNQFVSRNIKLATYANDEASVEYEKLQLTAGNIALPDVMASWNGSTDIAVALAGSATGIADRVVYAAFRKTEDAQLQFVASIVVSEAGVSGTFAGSLPAVKGEAVVYAYGIKDNGNNATTTFDNYQAETGEDVATLLNSRALRAGDYIFTVTKGTTLAFPLPRITMVKCGSAEVATTTGGNVSISRTGGTDIFINGQNMIGDWLMGVIPPASEEDNPSELMVVFNTPALGTYDITYNGVKVLTLTVTA